MNSSEICMSICSSYLIYKNLGFICLYGYSADLQKAIESENYAVAAELRDEISKLEV